MLSNMASSLIEHKRIKTTHQKAIALQRFIEPMITKAKDATLHNRRQVLKSLKNQDAVKILLMLSVLVMLIGQAATQELSSLVEELMMLQKYH